jgi:hypothetical protein
MPDNPAHLERPSKTFCVRLRIGHRTVTKKHVWQLLGIDGDTDAFPAVIDA